MIPQNSAHPLRLQGMGVARIKAVRKAIYIAGMTAVMTCLNADHITIGTRAGSVIKGDVYVIFTITQWFKTDDACSPNRAE